jgi:hypothetical protein
MFLKSANKFSILNIFKILPQTQYRFSSSYVSPKARAIVFEKYGIPRDVLR